MQTHHIIRTIPAALAIVVLTLAGCHDHNSNEHRSADHDQGTEDHSHEDHSQSQGLQLNQGQLWQADQSTRDGIHKMQEIVAATQPPLDRAQLDALHSDLKQELDLLIKNCEMTGPSHDMLHVYLNQVTPAISSLKDSDLEKARNAARSLPEILARFDQYFS